MSLKKESIISVPEVILLKQDTFYKIGIATANTDTVLTPGAEQLQINGGYLNPLIMSVDHSHSLTLSLTSAIFSKEFMAASLGETIQNSLKDVYQMNETVTLTAGVGTLIHQPSKGVVDIVANDENLTSIPVANVVNKSIDIGDSTFNGKVICSYFYQDILEGTKFGVKQGMTVAAIINYHYINEDGTDTGKYQVYLPKVKLNTMGEMSATADGVISQQVTGAALSYKDDDQETVFGTFNRIPDVATDKIANLVGIVINPNTATLAENETVALQVLAIRNYPYGNYYIPISDITFTTAGTSATIDVDGVVTGGATTGDTEITATFDNDGTEFTDTATITVE